MWAERAGRAAAVAALLLVAVLQVHRLDDSDTWWHLATGRRIVETHTVPRIDPFSYTAPGAPWINRQWLFETALYGSARLLGESAGPALFAGALFFAAFAALYALARRRLPRWAAAGLVVVASQAAVERFTVRPEAATLAFLAADLLLLDGRFGPRRAVAVVGLAVVWANTHALSVLGLVVVALDLGSALAARLPLPAGWQAASAREPDEIRWLAVAAAGAAVAEAATPFGIPGALYPAWLFGVIRGAEFISYTIVEHQPTALAQVSPAAAFGLVASLLLAAAATLATWRRLRLAHVGLAAGFVVLAFLARRNVALVGFGVAPLVATGLGRAAATLDAGLARRPLLAAAPAALVAVVALVVAGHVVRGDYYYAARLTRTCGLGTSTLLFPAETIDALTAAAPEARVFNDDLLGGFILWKTHPPRPIFFDGRLQVYPEAIAREFQRVLDDPRTFPEVAARWGIRAVVLHHPSPGRLELAVAIARLPGWRVAHLDAGGVLLLADGAPPAAPPAAASAAPATATEGFAAGVEAALLPVRRPIEDAIALYQRGRATLSLYGRAGIPSAAADFRAALRLWPTFDAAAVGLRATGAPRENARRQSRSVARGVKCKLRAY